MDESEQRKKNALVSVFDTFFKPKNLGKLELKDSDFMKNLETTFEKGPPYKAVKLVVTFLQAKAVLKEEDIRVLFDNFAKVCEKKINYQQARLVEGDQDSLYIKIILNFAECIKQILEAPSISEDFIRKILGLIFEYDEGPSRGKSGRISTQTKKINVSYQYLKELFAWIAQSKQYKEYGVQTEEKEDVSQIFCRKRDEENQIQKS